MAAGAAPTRLQGAPPALPVINWQALPWRCVGRHGNADPVAAAACSQHQHGWSGCRIGATQDLRNPNKPCLLHTSCSSDGLGPLAQRAMEAAANTTARPGKPQAHVAGKPPAEAGSGGSSGSSSAAACAVVRSPLDEAVQLLAGMRSSGLDMLAAAAGRAKKLAVYRCVHTKCCSSAAHTALAMCAHFHSNVLSTCCTPLLVHCAARRSCHLQRRTSRRALRSNALRGRHSKPVDVVSWYPRQNWISSTLVCRCVCVLIS